MSAQAGGQGLASRRWEHGLLHVQGDPRLVVSKRSQDGTLQRREDLALIKAKESALRALNVCNCGCLHAACLLAPGRTELATGPARYTHLNQTSEVQSLSL